MLMTITHRIKNNKGLPGLSCLLFGCFMFLFFSSQPLHTSSLPPPHPPPSRVRILYPPCQGIIASKTLKYQIYSILIHQLQDYVTFDFIVRSFIYIPFFFTSSCNMSHLLFSSFSSLFQPQQISFLTSIFLSHHIHK